VGLTGLIHGFTVTNPQWKSRFFDGEFAFHPADGDMKGGISGLSYVGEVTEPGQVQPTEEMFSFAKQDW
jgi:hypothetical protein